jgi:ketosteroid isomerase-like protein
MENQALFEKVLNTFDNNDSDGLLELMIDDFEWDMVGEQIVRGKEQVREMFANMNGSEMISCTKDLKLLDGDKGACHGTVKMKDTNGVISEMYYCDLYVFEGGLLKKMVTFSVKKG